MNDLNKKYTIPVTQEKRLYYQYLGFLNTLNIFSKNILDIENFHIQNIPISYSEFSKFNLNINLPLGKRVEHFFEFYIEQSKDYILLDKNIQIIKDKVTLGELDFIIKNTISNEVIHIELVYKYYLYTYNKTKEISKYIGVNNHDTLEDKTNKLLHKQFKLLFHNKTQQILEKIDISTIKQKVCFLANIFISPQNKYHQFDIINQNCVTGYYINIEQLNHQNQYFIPQKQDWLIDPKYCTIWYSRYDILVQIQECFLKNINPLVWEKENQKFQKIFVVKNNL
jgi:hypothetical protein